MSIARRVKSFVGLAVIAVSVSVVAGAGATIAGADPNMAAPPAAADPGPIPPAPPKEDPAPNGGVGALWCCYEHHVSVNYTLSPGHGGSAAVNCAPNQVVFGGGGWNSSGAGDVVLTDSLPRDHTSWLVYFRNNSTTTSHIIRAWAVCGMFAEYQ